MAGILFGVGVGPGDPELLTLKAMRIIRESDVIAVPGKNPEETVAYQIVWKAYPEISQKELLGIHMPMTKDEQTLRKNHEAGIRVLCQYLDKGKSIAFLTLGDPSVYSTYIYLHKEIQKKGYKVEMISGVPSFCAAAARLNVGIAEKAEQIHIIPASYQIEDALRLEGTKVLMKAGKKLPEVKKQLIKQGASAVMVENCGMDQEHVYYGTEQIPEDAGYYTLLFVKEGEEI